MRIFKNKWFARFARKEGISETKLREAVRDAEALTEENLAKLIKIGVYKEVQYDD